MASARSILTSECARKQIGSNTLTVYAYRYQDKPQKSIVGWIRLADYPQWEATMRTNPDAVKAWMAEAARRVLPHARKAYFEVAWAVVDQVVGVPKGFAKHETWSMGDGRYLTIRPLASSAQVSANDTIHLRPTDGLKGAAPRPHLRATAISVQRHGLEVPSGRPGSAQ